MLNLLITYTDGKTQYVSILDDEPLVDLAQALKAESVEILDYEL